MIFENKIYQMCDMLIYGLKEGFLTCVILIVTQLNLDSTAKVEG